MDLSTVEEVLYMNIGDEKLSKSDKMENRRVEFMVNNLANFEVVLKDRSVFIPKSFTVNSLKPEVRNVKSMKYCGLSNYLLPEIDAVFATNVILERFGCGYKPIKEFKYTQLVDYFLFFRELGFANEFCATIAGFDEITDIRIIYEIFKDVVLRLESIEIKKWFELPVSQEKYLPMNINFQTVFGLSCFMKMKSLMDFENVEEEELSEEEKELMKNDPFFKLVRFHLSYYVEVDIREHPDVQMFFEDMGEEEEENNGLKKMMEKLYDDKDFSNLEIICYFDDDKKNRKKKSFFTNFEILMWKSKYLFILIGREILQISEEWSNKNILRKKIEIPLSYDLCKEFVKYYFVEDSYPCDEKSLENVRKLFDLILFCDCHEEDQCAEHFVREVCKIIGSEDELIHVYYPLFENNSRMMNLVIPKICNCGLLSFKYDKCLLKIEKSLRSAKEEEELNEFLERVQKLETKIMDQRFLVNRNYEEIMKSNSILNSVRIGIAKLT